MVEFRIFGAMESEEGGGLLDLGLPKQRLVSRFCWWVLDDLSGWVR
jgi:hypothetical protein